MWRAAPSSLAGPTRPRARIKASPAVKVARVGALERTVGLTEPAAMTLIGRGLFASAVACETDDDQSGCDRGVACHSHSSVSGTHMFAKMVLSDSDATGMQRKPSPHAASSVHAAAQRRPESPIEMHALPAPPHAPFEEQRSQNMSWRA